MQYGMWLCNETHMKGTTMLTPWNSKVKSRMFSTSARIVLVMIGLTLIMISYYVTKRWDWIMIIGVYIANLALIVNSMILRIANVVAKRELFKSSLRWILFTLLFALFIGETFINIYRNEDSSFAHKTAFMLLLLIVYIIDSVLDISRFGYWSNDNNDRMYS